MPNPTANYPAALHERTDVSNLSGLPLGSPTAPKQTELAGKIEEEVYEIQRKIGLGEASAASSFVGEVLTSNGDGTTSWQVPTVEGGAEGVEALTEKLGGGMSVPDTDKILVGTGPGESEWQTASTASFGLDNVDNTADTDKPVSLYQQMAIDAKVADAINDGVSNVAPSQNAVFDALAGKESIVAPVDLTDGSHISTDASLGKEFRVTIAGNRTMDAPSNLTDGKKLLYRITQGSGGSRTITWASIFRFGVDIPQPVLSTTAGLSDYVAFDYNATANKLDCLGWSRGY